MYCLSISIELHSAAISIMPSISSNFPLSTPRMSLRSARHRGKKDPKFPSAPNW
jgi:hypothetical protein